MMPKSCARMRTMSLWGVTAKWPAWSLKMKLIVCLAPETYKDTAISVWACQAGFWKSTRTLCPQHNCENWQYRLVSKPFSSPQMIMYCLLYCNELTEVSCLINVFCFSLCRLIEHDWSMTELQWSWISHFSVYHNRNYYYIYITSKVVSNVTKSSATDGLLHVNCNVTIGTQTCFWSSQVIYCLPGVWVLVLYWRHFYFFVVIVESLLCIFRLSFVLFQVFCSLLWCFLHRRKCC